VHRHPLGYPPIRDDQLESGVARLPDLLLRRWAEDEDPRLRQLGAQRESLGNRCDAQRRGPRTERSAGTVDGAVPVSVRLDDGPQLGAVERAEQGLGVAAQRAQVDRDLAPHASGAR
jgi:hypothetical protein